MKNIIILAGPKGSGKTHIANAIASTHPNNHFTFCYSNSEFNIKEFNNNSLVILEGFPNLETIEKFYFLNEINEFCSLIITTTADISINDVDSKKYTLIKCDYNN